MKRPAGFYADSGDWPVGTKHGYTPDEVIEALTGGGTSTVAESKTTEQRAVKVIADTIYSEQYGADNTEFAGERMDLCDELAVEIFDQLAEHGLTIAYSPDHDTHRSDLRAVKGAGS